MGPTGIDTLPVPGRQPGSVVLEAPCHEPGCWAGGPSAVLDSDGTWYLAYRMRRPEGKGRGHANFVARSADGRHFETLVGLDRESFGAESLERPALVALPGGGWRLYVSCATPGTKHWRVDLLEADHPGHFDATSRRTVLPGDSDWGVKDPVIRWHDGRWHLWLCCHPLERDEDADRMVTWYGTSSDGVDWQLHGPALAGRPGAWDSRGARVTSVLYGDGGVFAYYDGRASAQENFEERTGVAAGDDGSSLTAAGDEPLASSPEGKGGLRYLSVVELAGGGHRLFYERARDDGSHDLYTEHVPPASQGS
ncbi:MAG TPA: hypothetical protein VMD59_22565 [Acidimicrobiales bacterium]|nr:hypothetical protein [Acidimicrobiales bacterium]